MQENQNLPPSYILQSFTQFINIVTQTHPEKETILKQLSSFSSFAKKHKYDIKLSNDYLKNVNLYGQSMGATRNELSTNDICEMIVIPEDIKSIARFTEEKYMISTSQELPGLCRAIILGVLLCDTTNEFQGQHYAYEEFNVYLKQFQGLFNITDILTKINKYEEVKFQIDLFRNLAVWLLQTNQNNTHLNSILEQNGIKEEKENNINRLTIKQVVYLLYLIQNSLKTEICTIVLIKKSSQEQRVLSFNANSQNPDIITILLELNDQEINFFLIVPRKKNARKYIQQIIQDMNKTTQNLIDDYKLNTNEVQVSSEIKQMKDQAFEQQNNNASKRLVRQDYEQKFNQVQDVQKSKECMICKNQFPIDPKDFESQITHFCQECKIKYLTIK